MPEISKAQMAQLFNRLGTTYGAGIDILSLLRKEAERGSPAYRIKMKSVADKVQNGESLAKALKNIDYFPELPLAVIEAGERGGRMEEAFHKLSHHYESLVKFRNAFLVSLSWPAFELVASVGIIGLLILALGWVANLTNSEPMISLGTGSSFGDFLLYCFLVSLFFGAIGIMILGTMKGWFGLYPMKLARRIPLVGKTIEAMALSRFAWTMSVAENAGMGAKHIVRLATRSTQNFFYTNHEKALMESVQSGKAFYPSMKATGAFPDDFLIYVDNGETAGELAETMNRASIDLQQRAERNMKILGTIGFAMMMMFVGIILVVTILTLFIKLYYEPLQNAIDNPMGCLISSMGFF